MTNEAFNLHLDAYPKSGEIVNLEAQTQFGGPKPCLFNVQFGGQKPCLFSPEVSQSIKQTPRVLREQKMLKGHLPRVIHHQVYEYAKI